MLLNRRMTSWPTSLVFGAKMTAAKAVATLEALIARIKDEGLIVGRIGVGDFVHEPIGRELTVDDVRSFDISDQGALRP